MGVGMHRSELPRNLGLVGAIAGCLFLGACARVVSAPPSGDPVAASLHKLGVNTTTSKRKSPTGTDLPSSFAPLGTTASFGNADTATSQSVISANDQLLLIGNPRQASNLTTTCATSGVYKAELLMLAQSNTQTAMDCFVAPAWLNATGNGTTNLDPMVQSLRSVATGDIDGDGLQELVAAYVTTGSDPRLKLEIIQDSREGFTTSVTDLMDAKNVTDVQVATGDFNGDGTDNIVIALASRGNPGRLLFLQKAHGTYQVDSSLTKSLPRTLNAYSYPNAAMYFRLATGNLDYDRADELGIVVDELAGGGTTGASNYYIYDDANHGFQFLKGGVVQGTDATGTHVALAGDISFGDIDGDGLSEVVMGGPTVFTNTCTGHFQVVTALDDAAHGFSTLGTAYANSDFCSGSVLYSRNLFTFVNTLDLTGSGRDSIVANQFVYDYCSKGLCDNTPMEPSTTTPLLSAAYLGTIATTSDEVLSPTHVAVAVGDVTGDGRQNLLIYAQWHDSVSVYGITQGNNGTWGQGPVATIDTPPSDPSAPLRPQLVTTESEVGGPVLKYVAPTQTKGGAGGGGSPEVFTQPIVVAALAAPPCQDNSGQNTAACVTTFGKSNSLGATTSTSVNVTAGVTVGEAVESGVAQFSESAKATIQATATLSTSHSYNLTRSVTYSTSSMKDGVVFTTVPLDQYKYKIVQAADRALIGKFVVVSIPRTPIVLIADRSYYNASVPPGALKIDSRVFKHKAGDVSSYPTTPHFGITIGPKEVGEGTGSTQLSIDVSKDFSVGATLAVQFTVALETTEAGVVTGFNVGVGASKSLQITGGQSTTFTGTVGSIDAADYAANRYGFGMSAYVQALDGQAFEVVNYWVQP